MGLNIRGFLVALTIDVIAVWANVHRRISGIGLEVCNDPPRQNGKNSDKQKDKKGDKHQ